MNTRSKTLAQRASAESSVSLPVGRTSERLAKRRRNLPSSNESGGGSTSCAPSNNNNIASHSTSILLNSPGKFGDVLKKFEKEDDEVKHLSRSIVEHERKLKDLEMKKRKRMEDFKSMLISERTKYFEDKLREIYTIKAIMRELHELASDLDRKDVQECPICYEVIFSFPEDEEHEEPRDKIPNTLTGRTLNCGHLLCHSCFIHCTRSCDSADGDHYHLRCPVCRNESTFYYDE